MKSTVSENLRRRQVEADLALTPVERIRRCLEIGRRDLRMFMTANELSYAQALEILRANQDKARRAAWMHRNRGLKREGALGQGEGPELKSEE